MVYGKAEFNFVKLQIGVVAVVGRAVELVVLVRLGIRKLVIAIRSYRPAGLARLRIKR